MAYQVLGNVIISDSRELLGVGTAGINTALYVGESFEVDAVSGVATAAGLSLGASGGVIYNSVSTDLGISSAATDLASAEAIVNYVGSQIVAGAVLDFTDGTTAGEVGLGTETFSILGTDNEIVSTTAVAAGNTVTFSLSTALELPGSLAFAAVPGDTITSIGVNTDLGGATPSANILPTQQAVKEYVDAQVGIVTTGDGDLNVNNIDASGYVQVGSGLTANGGLDVVGHAELDTLRVSGLSTFQSLVALDGGANLLAGQSLGIQTADGTLQSITHVGVNTGLLELGGLPSNNVLPTERAVKLYIDSQVEAANQLAFEGDNAVEGDIDLANETLFVLGGTNIDTDVAIGAGNTITISLEDTVVLAGGLQVGTGLTVVAGGANITGVCSATDFNSTSDINKKENIEEIPAALEKVEALRGVLFDWKDGSGRSGGIIAQEVEAVLPELVRENGDHKTVIYNGLIGLLINAVKELSAEVEELKKHHQ